MICFSKKVEISATPAMIWSVMQDVEKWHEWTATIISIKKLTGPGFAPGTRMLIEQPQLPKGVWEIFEMRWQKSFSMKKGNAFIRVVADHTLEPVQNGTMVGLSISFYGLLANLVAKRYGAMMETYLATEAAGLKSICESQGQRSNAERMNTWLRSQL